MTRVGNAKKKNAKNHQAKEPRNNKIKKTAEKSSSSKGPAKKDYKDLGMAYLAEGLSAVEALIKQHDITASIVRRAARHIENSYPEKADMFRKFVEKNYSAGVRGRASPVEGEVRVYKPQQVKKGSGNLFLHLPVGLLGVSVVRDAEGNFVSKDRVCVKFTGKKIEIWKEL